MGSGQTAERFKEGGGLERVQPGSGSALLGASMHPPTPGGAIAGTCGRAL